MDAKADIIFQNVRFCYGEVCALSNVSFSIMPKKLTALVGPNGGGKSTIIKLMTGLLKPDEGAVICREGTQVGYVPQNVSFDTFFPLTVGELVLQGTLPKKISPFRIYTGRQKEKAAYAIKRVGLSGFACRGIGQLSGGQLKRAVIARALASDADIIALDEPDASLDVDAVKEFYGILDLLKNEKTMIIASHNIETVLDIADSAVYVNKTITKYVFPDQLKAALKGGVSL
jgi:zinc transport system ATP-binding protein